MEIEQRMKIFEEAVGDKPPSAQVIRAIGDAMFDHLGERLAKLNEQLDEAYIKLEGLED